MKWRVTIWVGTVTFIGLAPAPLLGQDDPACSQSDTLTVWQYLRTCVPADLPVDTADLLSGVHEAFVKLKSPATLNSELGEIEGATGAGKVLGRFHLHFMNVQEEDGDVELALRYRWSKDLVRSPFSQRTSHWGLHVAAESQGLATAQAADNPEDFIESSVQINVFRSSGGTIDGADIARHLATLADSIAKYETLAATKASPTYTTFMGEVWNRVSTQTFVTIGIEARFETDQTFDRTQWVYGGRIGLDVKAWVPGSTLARWNVVDWPAALLRYVTGADESFQPNGAAIPTILVSLHSVNPSSHPERAAAGDLGSYARLGFEVTYRSTVAEAHGAPVWIELGYRHFSELGASRAISDADLDQSNRFRIVLSGPSGLTISWATGSLPLDQTDGNHWGVGLKVSL